MKESRTLAEWIESKGNPEHFISEHDGHSFIAIEDNNSFSHGITVYPFREYQLPNGEKKLSLNNGWGIRDEYLPAIKGLLDKIL